MSRPHPHNLVGGTDCVNGICMVKVNKDNGMAWSFNALGIQCVKRNNVEASLMARKRCRIDPYGSK